MAVSRPIARKPEPEPLSLETRAKMRRWFSNVLLIDLLCVFAAFAGIFGHVTLRQVWGLPLFVLAMLVGFGAQIAFIVALVKASREEKGV